MVDKKQLANYGHDWCTNTMTNTSTELTRWLFYRRVPKVVFPYHDNLEYKYIVVRYWQYRGVLLPYMVKDEKKRQNVCKFGGYYRTPTRWYYSNWLRYGPKSLEQFSLENPDIKLDLNNI